VGAGARVPVGTLDVLLCRRSREHGGAEAGFLLVPNRPISVYRLSEMPIQSCGQSVSAQLEKMGARLNAHTELRAKRQHSAREAIYRIRPIIQLDCQNLPR